MKLKCPNCGSNVKVFHSDEGTGHYEPIATDDLAERLVEAVKEFTGHAYNIDFDSLLIYIRKNLEL